MPRKGQILSSEAVEKIRQSKFKKWVSKLSWDHLKEYMDVELNASSRGRVKKFITLREFKDRVENGQDVKTMKEDSICKHLLNFYSIICQDGLPISKEKFLEEYERGISLDEICKNYNISREHMTFLRQLFDVKTKGATFIQRKKIEKRLTKEQIEVLYGSMMGDAKKLGMGAAYFGHSKKQKNYLLWKYKIFENICPKNALKCKKNIEKRSDQELEQWYFYTHTNDDIIQCISKFYNGKIKHISNEVLSQLTPLSIAVWFMDDGQADYNHRFILNNKTKESNRFPLYIFCTESFTKEDCERIQKWFKNQYDINTKLKKRYLRETTGYRIVIKKSDAEKFVELISPHILPMFQYKIDYNKYLEKRDLDEEGEIHDQLFKFPLGSDFSHLEKEKQDEYINNLVKYYQMNGIESLLDKDYNWETYINSIFSYDATYLLKEDHIAFSNVGNKMLLSHFPNFWSAKAKGSMSMKEVFNNKQYLSEILRTIIIRGTFPNEIELFKSLCRYRGNKRISGFMPCVAKAIYEKYCENKSSVLDFCAGFGGRMVGAMSCKKVESYTGSDVNIDTYFGLLDLYQTINKHTNIEKQVNIINQDSITFMQQFRDNNFDFCFTSPPYYNAEEYTDDDSQSYKKFETYNKWFNMFLVKSILEAMRISKKVGINIANTGGYDIADDLRKYMVDNRIKFNEDALKIPRFGGKFKFEPLFIIYS